MVLKQAAVEQAVCSTAKLNRKYIEKLQEKLEKFESEVTMDFAKNCSAGHCTESKELLESFLKQIRK